MKYSDHTPDTQLEVLIEQLTTAIRQPLLVAQKDVPALLGLSLRAFFRLKSAGVLPLPVAIEGEIKYRRSDLEKWVKRLKSKRY